MYHRLLLILHPDRSPLENSEKICNMLVESFKKREYLFLFYMYRTVNCQVKLSRSQEDTLVLFLRKELVRIQVTIRMYRKKIQSFKR